MATIHLRVATAPPVRDEAERRRLSVMICDLMGSTALSARLDPEDMGAVMEAYHAACARIVQAYDGFLGDFRGDGILAYFGSPRAHEDDAERRHQSTCSNRARLRLSLLPAPWPRSTPFPTDVRR
jgi:class 3 adenylate cyclase